MRQWRSQRFYRSMRCGHFLASQWPEASRPQRPHSPGDRAPQGADVAMGIWRDSERREILLWRLRKRKSIAEQVAFLEILKALGIRGM